MAKHKKKTPKKASKLPKGPKENTEKINGTGGGSDWIAALAKEASSSPSNSNAKVLSKQERIEKRNAKKRRREERKGITDHSHDKNKTSQGNRYGEGSGPTTEEEVEEMRIQSRFYMQDLSEQVQSTVDRIAQELKEANASQKHRRITRPYVAPEKTILGKATAGQQLSQDMVQPRKKDYGGLGLARPSLLLNLRDLSFVPKLEEEFAEHVPGFFGKQRTKAMKRQLDGDMLWRRLQKQKQGGGKGGKGRKQDMNTKLDGKKLSDMSPDERVEAMIKLGMI